MRRSWTFLLSMGGFLVLSMMVPFGPATEPSHSYLSSAHRPFYYRPPPTAAGLAEFEATDEWQGQEAALLLEERFAIGGDVPGAASHTLRPSSTARVFPGTARMVVTVDVLDGRPEVPITVRYRAADDRTGTLTFAGSGSRSLTVFESMNDWNLDPQTRWRFVVSTESPLAVTLAVRIEIQRAEDPELVARYPSLWLGRDQVVLFDQRGALEDAGFLGATPGDVLGARPPEAPRLGRTPPVGVQWIDVSLHYNSTTERNLHYRPVLSWRGADTEAPTWEVSGAAPELARRAHRDGLFQWRLPTEPRMWDSLFGRETRFELRVDWGGGVQPYHVEGDYHLQVTAHRLPADPSLGA